MNRPIYIVGDIHGKFQELEQIIHRHDIHDCYLICVGDLGIGFQHRIPEARMRVKLRDYFASRAIEFLSIRGNHDDPAFFSGCFMHASPWFRLVPDYTYLELNGQTFLFVGGGISIDRTGSHRVEGRSYWSNERLVVRPELITKLCDVLITHPIPHWIGPVSKGPIRRWLDADPGLEKILDEERSDVSRLIDLCQPKHAYFGHFHMSEFADYGLTRGRILDELEIYEHRAVN